MKLLLLNIYFLYLPNKLHISSLERCSYSLIYVLKMSKHVKMQTFVIEVHKPITNFSFI
jgi:hypothetical protein